MPNKTTAVQPTPAGSILAGVSNSRRWAVVAMLFTASLINYFDRASLSIALPLISKEFSLGPEAQGLLLSTFFWSYMLMQIPIGWASDHLNLRWLYSAAFILWSFAQGAAGVARSFVELIGTRIILGIGESIYLPGGTKIVSLLFNSEERGLPSGVFDFGTRIGIAAGGLCVPLLVIHYGWRISFILIGFIALLWLFPWLKIAPRHLQAESPKPAPLPAERPSVLPSFSHIKNWRRFTSRDLIGLCVGFFGFDYYWYLLVTWLPDYLVVARHQDILKAGMFSALPFLVYGLSEPLGGWLADRLVSRGWNDTLTRKGIISVAFAFGLLLIPAALVHNVTLSVLLIMGACLVGLSTGNISVMVQACAPYKEIGIWTGFQNCAGNIGGVLAPLVTGILISRTGSYTPAFILATAVLVVSLAAYWLIVGELNCKEDQRG
jgi:MFS transporter, ACS family, D-galactonate transporter